MKFQNKFYILLTFFILNSSFLISLRAQFLNAVGITGGVTFSNERWNDKVLNTSERKKYIFGFNGSVFVEFFSHDYFRWVSEIQFNQKGSMDKTPDANYPTRMDYLCFNNYLKFRYELLDVIPYIIVGPRIEYKLSGGSTSPRVPGSFVPLHVSLAAGVGTELVAYGPIKFFVEAFYNPDLTKAYHTDFMDVKNNAFEARIGVKYQFRKKNKRDLDCNSPTYIPY